jgi:hypothetical protein
MQQHRHELMLGVLSLNARLMDDQKSVCTWRSCDKLNLSSFAVVPFSSGVNAELVHNFISVQNASHATSSNVNIKISHQGALQIWNQNFTLM